MKVLFCVSAWPTHYMASVPTAWALRAAGHEVRVLCAPSQTGPVGRAGLTAVPLLSGMDVETQNRLLYYRQAAGGDWPYPWLPLDPVTGAELSRLAEFDVVDFERRLLPGYAADAARSCDAAVGYGRQWQPDLVLFDPMSLEGILVAEECGAPAALFLWGPVGTDEPAPLRLLPYDVSGSYARYGLPELGPKLVRHVIDPCPASLAPPTQAVRLPVRYVPYNGGGVLPDWLLERSRRPRVCVTWSTALSRMSGPRSYLLRSIVDGCIAAGLEVVVTSTSADVAAFGAPPSGVRLLEQCPLQLLLPTCAAVVHHGGAGSTMTAVVAGVPQLVITFASEQTANGERLAATGAGITVLGHEADPETVRDAVDRLVCIATYREQAGALAAQAWWRPTPAELVDGLVALAATGN